MRNKGFTLIELLVVILIIGILLALIIPNFVLFQERARRASVKNNMHVVQTALEAYAVDHVGNYPGEEVFEDEDESMFLCYFPGGDPFGVEGEPIFGSYPINPYTGRRYNDPEMGELDFGYNINEVLEEAGQNAARRSDDEEPECPYIELTPEDAGCDDEFQGAMAFNGYVPEAAAFEDIPQEYSIIGWGRDMFNPMYDRDPSGEEELYIYFVLHN